MENYSVKQLAKLAGVSVRTLHLYDEIGLLKPARRTDKKYRFYGKGEALRLQQILFYKELGMPLKEIAEILDDPQFDEIKALLQHKHVLEQKQSDLQALLHTIDKTIDHLKNKSMLTIEELYKGFSSEQISAMQKEAIEEWGDAVRRAENHLRKKSKADFEALKLQAGENVARLINMMNQDPKSEMVQSEIAKHYQIIREFWGTAGSPDKQAEAYAGLADLYLHDERYTMQNGMANPAFAAFLQKAMKYFAKTLQ